MQKFKSDYVDMLANASYVGLLLIPFFVDHPDIWQYTFWVIAAVALFAWSSSIYRYVSISSQPVSKIASSAQGYVELIGKIKFSQKEKLSCPSGEACVWYRRTKYEMDITSSTSSSLWNLFDRDLLTILGLGIKENIWRKTDEESSELSFLIEDGTGESIVKPINADFFTKTTRTYYEGGFVKFDEELLMHGENVYVLGEFKTHGFVHAVIDAEKATSVLLAEWKVDKESFHRRFDENKNAVIDLKEWENARRMARREVQARQQSNNTWHEIFAPNDDRMFLISTFSPQELKNKFLHWSCLHLLILTLSLILVFGLKYVGIESSLVSEAPDANYDVNTEYLDTNRESFN